LVPSEVFEGLYVLSLRTCSRGFHGEDFRR
jgi:hypothetical protein